MNCPVCGKENIDTNTCPQCKSDLTPWLRLKVLPETYYAEGLQLFKSGRLDKAIEKLMAAIALNYHNSSAHILLAHIYEKKGLYDDAVLQIDKAIEKGSPNSEELKSHKNRIKRLKKEQEQQRKGRWVGSYKWIATSQIIAFICLIFIILVGYQLLKNKTEEIRDKGEVRSSLLKQLQNQNNNLQEDIRNIMSIVKENRNIISKFSQPRQNYFKYLVTKGDTLSSIADRFYHDPNMWQKIYQANKKNISDPNYLPTGIILDIPME